MSKITGLEAPNQVPLRNSEGVMPYRFLNRR